METYVYKGINKKGKNKKGEVDGVDRKDAFEQLKGNGIYATEVKLKQDGVYEERMDKVGRDARRLFDFVFKKRKKKKQMESFKEELTKLGYGNHEVVNILKSETYDSFDVDNYRRQMGLSDFQVEKIKEGRLTREMKDSGKAKSTGFFNINFGVPSRDMLIFTQKLSLMLRSNVDLLKALETSQVHFTNKRLNSAVSDLIYDVSRGNGLADSMEKHPDVFDELYVSMVRVGEGTDLSKALDDLVGFLEMKADSRANFRAAMAYPSFILLFVFAVLTVISLFLAPMMQDMFVQMGVDIPMLTRVVFLVANIWPLILVGFLLTVVVVLAAYFNSPPLKEKILVFRDYLAIRLFKVKDMMNVLLMYQVSMTLRTTLSNNIDIKKSLELASKVVSNRYVRRDISDVYFLLEQGETVSNSFASKAIFPPDFKISIEAGDISGDLAVSVDEISKEYKKELTRLMAKLNSIVTYSGVILAGLIVIPVVFALFLPLLDMYQQIGSVR